MPRREEPIFNIKLVQVVKNNPCLYDYTLREYNNRDLVNAAWESIATQMNETVRNCKEIWRNLRIVYTRNLKSNLKGNCKRKKKYYLLDRMDFLKPFLSFKSARIEHLSPLPVQICYNEQIAQSNVSTVDNNDDSEQNDKHTQEIVIEKDEKAQNLKRPKFNRYKENSLKKIILLKNCSKNNRQMSSEKNLIKKQPSGESYRNQFLQSLLPDVEEMSSAQFRKFRIQVATLIEEILDPTAPASPSWKPSSSSLAYESTCNPIVSENEDKEAVI